MCGVYELTKKVDLLSAIRSANLSIPAYSASRRTQAAHARPDAATVEDRQWSKAPAIGNDHDRHRSERECRATVAIHSRKLDGRFIKEALSGVQMRCRPSQQVERVLETASPA